MNEQRLVGHERSARPESGHQQNQQAAGYYEATAEDEPVVGQLLEENQRDRLRHHEEDRDVDSHQPIEIEAAATAPFAAILLAGM